MQIVARDEIKLVGLEVETRWMQICPVVASRWEYFLLRSGEIQNRINDTFTLVIRNTKEAIYTVLIAAEVSEVIKPPVQFTSLTIPPSTYVHESHNAGSDELIYTVGSMYSWGEDMGRTLSNQRIIEGYRADRKNEVFNVYIPVEK